jgi:predicted ATPase
MLIHSLKLKNILSFGSKAQTIELRPLNIIIGPNSSGKSNLIESFELLRNTPVKLQDAFRENGGISDWIWKGAKENPAASLDVTVGYTEKQNLRYSISFTINNQRFEMIDECIEYIESENNVPQKYYSFDEGYPTIYLPDRNHGFDIDTRRSILSQRYDPDRFPAISYLADCFSAIRVYRQWSFGPYSPVRLPQKADLPNDFLERDSSNMALILNRLRQYPEIKQKILHYLHFLYDDIKDFDVRVEGGTVQVFLQEQNNIIPASRLSDGTLHFLCLLVILLTPHPSPVICIEEPELGLHPDVMPVLAELLKDASERCQLIITTHSDILVDAMTDTPESVMVCERNSEGTSIKRLSERELKPWLEKYRLGELWSSGEIGGNRW